jgi:galactokinase
VRGETRQYIVPGRVELVGKHVDYAGGRSLTCPVDLTLRVRAAPLSRPIINVRTSLHRGLVTIDLDPRAARMRSTWSTYVAAVARRFARDFPHFRTGVSLEIDGDLPASAGLSSSSAFVVAVATALADANDARHDRAWIDAIPTDLARAEYFAAIETGAPYGSFQGEDGVGVRGGAQDPIAIICGAEGAVSQFSYLPARLERSVAWPFEFVLAIGVSGVRATKTGNARDKYNRAADAMRGLATAWNAATGRNDETVAGALASAPDAGDRLAHVARDQAALLGDEYLVRRLAQFREETEVIVPGVSDAFRDRNFSALGVLVDRSQQLAEHALDNQVPETVTLVRAARERGAVAASAFGAGFGGAVWAMIPVETATVFVGEWREAYGAAFPDRIATARWIVTRPSAPLRETTDESKR